MLFSQNFEKITHRVQSKNKDQVLSVLPRCSYDIAHDGSFGKFKLKQLLVHELS
jgi:hypothetical protein